VEFLRRNGNAGRCFIVLWMFFQGCLCVANAMFHAHLCMTYSKYFQAAIAVDVLYAAACSLAVYSRPPRIATTVSRV
jgi:hypothetical protein